jgi:WD40 repeat protein
LPGQKSTITSLTLSKNENFLFSMSKNGLLFIWDLSKFTIVNKIDSFSAPNSCLAFALSDPIYTLFGRDRDNKKVLRAVNLLSGETIKSVKVHQKSIRCLLLDNSNHFLFTGGTDGIVNVMTVTNCQIDHTFLAHEGAVNALCVSSNDQFLVTASDDKSVKVFNTKHDFVEIRKLKLEVEVSSILFSKQNKKIFTGGWNFKPIRIWDVSCLGIEDKTKFTNTPGQFYMVQAPVNWNKECGKTAQQKIKENIIDFEDGLRRVYDQDLTNTTMDHLKRLSQLKSGVVLKKNNGAFGKTEKSMLSDKKDLKIEDLDDGFYLSKKDIIETSGMGSLAMSYCKDKKMKTSFNLVNGKEDEGMVFKAKALFKKRIVKGKPVVFRK